MEEWEDFEEQPETVETSFEENELGSSMVNDEMQNDLQVQETSEAERGVPLGKFKSVEDLFEAYNNLQAEFTRKSQRLSQLEKDKSSKNDKVGSDFDDRFRMFLSKNQEAEFYADELKTRVLENESLADDEAAFDKVWAGMLYEKLSAPNKAKEPLIQNLILKDNDLKNLVIENYMKQLQSQNTPIVMSSGTGERVTKTVAPKPDSFEQAKKVVLDLLS